MGGPNDYGGIDFDPSNRWLLERRPLSPPCKRETLSKRGRQTTPISHFERSGIHEKIQRETRKSNKRNHRNRKKIQRKTKKLKTRNHRIRETTETNTQTKPRRTRSKPDAKLSRETPALVPWQRHQYHGGPHPPAGTCMQGQVFRALCAACC